MDGPDHTIPFDFIYCMWICFPHMLACGLVPGARLFFFGWRPINSHTSQSGTGCGYSQRQRCHVGRNSGICWKKTFVAGMVVSDFLSDCIVKLFVVCELPLLLSWMARWQISPLQSQLGRWNFESWHSETGWWWQSISRPTRLVYQSQASACNKAGFSSWHLGRL